MTRRAWLSEYARRGKKAFFLDRIQPGSTVLEIGCASGWVGDHFRQRGGIRYTGLDLNPPADVVGDVRNWRSLGLTEAAFDAVIAFEVVEHVDCFRACFDLLKPGGLLMLTSPLPSMDWFCRLLEGIGLTQRRTSPHDHLIRFTRVPLFEPVELKVVGLAAQWGLFRKPRGISPAPGSPPTGR